MPLDYKRRKEEGYTWVCVFIKNEVTEMMRDYAFYSGKKTREIIEEALKEYLEKRVKDDTK